MNRRPASLPKSPLNSRSFLRRALARRPVALALPLLVLQQSAFAANTEFDVVNGQTDLTNAAGTTYKTGGTTGTGAGGMVTATVPSVTSDVTFDSGTVYSPAAFTLNSSLTFGSLNDLSTTALTIANTSTTGTGDTLTLGGSGDLGDSVPGSAAGDLFFLGTGATLTINSGVAGSATALGLVLGQSGNFDVTSAVQNAATINSVISDGGNGYSITKTGAGLLGLNAANTFGGGVNISAGTVETNNATGLGTGTIALGAAGSATSVGLQLTSITISNAITVNAGGARAIYQGSNTSTVAGLITFVPGSTLNFGPNGAAGTNMNMTGGTAGTGNLVLGYFEAGRSGQAVNITGTTVNQVGTITDAFNNTAVTGSLAGTGNVNISANIGSNVTNVIVNSPAGLMTLSGTNSFQAGTVTQGALDYQVAAALPSSGTTTVAAAGTLILGVGGTTGFTSANVDSLFANTLANVSLNAASGIGLDTTPGTFTYGTSQTTSRAFTKLGTNSLILTGTDNFVGGTVLAAGTLQLGNGGTTGSLGNSPVVSPASTALGAGGTFIVDRSNATVQGTDFGVINGAIALTINGGGTTTLNQANAFTGTTTISNGSTLDLQNSLAIGSSILANGGTGVVFDSAVASHAFSIGGLNGSTGLALTDSGGNAVALTLGGGTQTAATATYTGVLSGGGSLIKSGNNTQILSANETYTGSTTINQGTLGLTFTATATTNILPAGTAFSMGGAPANTFAETNSAFPSGPTLTVTSASGAANSQTFTNGVTFNRGYSQINTVDTGTGTVLLALNGITQNAGAVVNFTPGGTLGAANAITTTAAADSTGILGGYATYNKAGYATVNGSGQIVQYTGGTTVTAGALTSNTATNYQTSTGGTYTIGAGTTTSLNTFATTSTTATTFTIGTGQTLNFGVNGGLLLSSAASGAVTFGSTASAGTITAGGTTANTPGTLNIVSFNGAVNINPVIADNGTGATTLVWSNAGSTTNSLTLNGANTYSGGTYIDSGRVVLGASSTAGATAGTTASGPLGTGTVYIMPGADLNVSSKTLTNNLVISGLGNSETTGNGNYAGALRFGSGDVISGTVTLAGDSGVVSQGTGGTISGNISGAFNFDFASTNGASGATLTLSGNNSGLTGNLTLNGPVAGVTINPVSPVTVKFGSTTAGVGGNVVLNGTNPGSTSTTLDLNGFSNSVGGLISVGSNSPRTTVTNSGTSATLTLGINNASASYGGVITDGGTGKTLSIVQAGTGVQVFTGANTYNGTTTVNAGTLLYNGSLTPTVTGGSAVTVGAATPGTLATLGGTGLLTVTSVTVNQNGTLAPGATVGATTGALTLNTTSGVTINGTLVIGVNGTANTLLATTGGLSLNAMTSTLTINGTLNGTSDYAVATSSTAVAGSFFSSNVPSNYSIVLNDPAFDNGGGDIELEPITAVPEPSTVWAGVLMLGGAGWYYRRQSRCRRA